MELPTIVKVHREPTGRYILGLMDMSVLEYSDGSYWYITNDALLQMYPELLP